MIGPELCPKCKGLHFRNAPCIVRATKSEQRGGREAQAKNREAQDPAQMPKRGPGRPKTITDMRAYKAMKAREYRARPKPTTKREKDE